MASWRWISVRLHRMHGTTSSPARMAAAQRRSPQTIWNRPSAVRVTSNGCSKPTEAIDAVRSFSLPRERRGLSEQGTRSATETSTNRPKSMPVVSVAPLPRQESTGLHSCRPAASMSLPQTYLPMNPPMLRSPERTCTSRLTAWPFRGSVRLNPLRRSPHLLQFRTGPVPSCLIGEPVGRGRRVCRSQAGAHTSGRQPMGAARARHTITVVGAGLSGLFAAILLARRGFPVVVYERDGDPRSSDASCRRPSLNLAISERGLAPLARAGLREPMLERAASARGRLVHHGPGRAEFEPYGTADQALHFVLRRDFAAVLL